MNQTWWLIEGPGPCYLGVRQLGGYEFYWTADVFKGLKFSDREQGDMAMMCIRQLRGDLFPACYATVPRAVEHVWVQGGGVQRSKDSY